MSFPTADALTAIANNALVACGAAPLGAGPHSARSPITGATLGFMPATDDVDTMAAKAATAFQRWRSAPAPLRGELVRRLGEQLRLHKADLARLVTLEAGKIES